MRSKLLSLGVLLAASLLAAACGNRPGLGQPAPDGGRPDAALTADGGAPPDATPGPDAESAPDAAPAAEGVLCGDTVCTNDPCCQCSDTLACDVERNYCCGALFAYFACDGPEDCAASERCCQWFPGHARCCPPGEPGYDDPLCHGDPDCPGAKPFCCPYISQAQSPSPFSICSPTPCAAP